MNSEQKFQILCSYEESLLTIFPEKTESNPQNLSDSCSDHFKIKVLVTFSQPNSSPDTAGCEVVRRIQVSWPSEVLQGILASGYHPRGMNSTAVLYLIYQHCVNNSPVLRYLTWYHILTFRQMNQAHLVILVRSPLSLKGTQTSSLGILNLDTPVHMKDVSTFFGKTGSAG